MEAETSGFAVSAQSVRKRPYVKDPAPAARMLLGYARVSKGDEQNNALQAKALRAVGCRKLFEEAASGGRWDRPELHRMLDQIREGDTVWVVAARSWMSANGARGPRASSLAGSRALKWPGSTASASPRCLASCSIQDAKDVAGAS